MSAPRSAAQKRPTTARKVTAKTEANRRGVLDEGVQITLDGQTYTLRNGDITPRLARELRRETGHSYMKLIALLAEDPDVDVIGEAIWLARRVAGEIVTLDDIVLDYATVESDGFDMDLAAPSEVDASPEA